MAVANHQLEGGFPLDVIDGPVEEKYKCGVCKLILREPVQAYCGHRFCKTCWLKVLNNEAVSSVCDEDCKLIDRSHEWCPDPAVLRELWKLPARCVETNCSWKGNYRDYIEHDKICRHVKHAYEFKQGSAEAIDGPCQKCSGEFQVVGKHDVMRCASCTYTKKKEDSAVARARLDLMSHVDREMALRTAERHKEEEIQQLKDKVTAMEEELRSVREVNEKWAVLQEQRRKTDKNASENKERVAILEEQVRQLQSDLGRTERAFSRQVFTNQQEVEQLRMSGDFRFRTLETTSYNGTLNWRLSDYYRRKQESEQSQGGYSSPPFYTSRSGYKMCARVYLNGDGTGQSSHVSLFFVIMRGDYDAILSWPFRQKVTLMLLKTEATSGHAMTSFRPDPDSSSFRRPTTEMNIASGCPLLVSQTEVERRFVEDDAIYIKVIVDTSDLPLY